MTGVAAKRVERLARELVEFRPSMAVIGGPPLAHTNGLFTALAVNALNALLGAVGEPGGIFFTPGVSAAAQPLAPQPLRNLSAKVLLLDEANPVFGTPKAWQVRETLEKVPFIASFGSFIDDTSSHADLILPDHSFLESWVDSTPESGSIEPVTTVAGPVMKPLHQTRATADVLIEVAGKLKAPVALPWKTAEEAGELEADAGVQAQSSPQSASPQVGASRRSARLRRAAVRRRRRAVSVPLPAVRVAGVRRRLGRAPAVAAGNARSADLGDVEQLGGDQSADRRALRHRAGRRGRGRRRRRARCARRR